MTSWILEIGRSNIFFVFADKLWTIQPINSRLASALRHHHLATAHRRRGYKQRSGLGSRLRFLISRTATTRRTLIIIIDNNNNNNNNNMGNNKDYELVCKILLNYFKPLLISEKY